MNQETRITAAPSTTSRRGGAAWLEALRGLTRSQIVLILGVLAMAVPTMLAIARFSWSTEQGGHGPIVLATGLWLLVGRWPAVKHHRAPGSPVVTAVLLAGALIVYFFSRITGVIETEGFAFYGALLTTVYALFGWRVIKGLWFPLLYLAFVFPPPDTLVAAFTQPIKIIISETAVDLLFALGYPIASSGVTIQVAQYELLVAAACAGMNSIISLTAIGLFYVYIRHNANYRYAALMLLAIIPAAIFANFARVLILILITYHFGDAAAQGFMHNFAGIAMFVLALMFIFLIDALAAPLRRRLGDDSAHRPGEQPAHA